jgi:hypothetical protein
MRRHKSRGNSAIEFALIVPVMITLLLGTFGIGINLIHALEVVQLARDAGHMFARGVDFTSKSPGNVKILGAVGESLGLDIAHPSSSKAVVYLSKLTYVDNATCHAGGQPDNCQNHGKWVFVQRQLIFGGTGIYSSTFGNPASVPVQADGLKIAPSVYVTNGEAVCTRCSTLGIVPQETSATGVPSQEFIYISEAAVQGIAVGGIVVGSPLPAYGVF